MAGAGTQQQIAILRILLATCLTTLDALNAAGDPLDDELVIDLDRLISRTKLQLEGLANPS